MVFILCILVVFSVSSAFTTPPPTYINRHFIRTRTTFALQAATDEASTPAPNTPVPDSSLFGQEFTASVKAKTRDNTYWKGKQIVVLPPQASAKRQQRENERFTRAKVTFIIDSVYISLLGLCVTWYFGTPIDSFSYFIGSVLGLGYANLLTKFVEKLGTAEKSVGGNARFIPVILLILVYAKNKETIHIIPELIGFFSYQAGSLLQIFNADLYGEEDED
jgi:hypothetical protein